MIGTGTHNTGIKHGILPTQVRQESGACRCTEINISRASGEMSHPPVWVCCAQPWSKEGAHCKQEGSYPTGMAPKAPTQSGNSSSASQNMIQLKTPLSLCFMVL